MPKKLSASSGVCFNLNWCLKDNNYDLNVKTQVLSLYTLKYARMNTLMIIYITRNSLSSSLLSY